ncbi:MAG: CopG family ribbon-helix-helix protein [Chloroflexota bacterium]
MSTAIEPTALLSARIPQTMKTALDDLAKATGRNRTMLVQEALRRLIEVEQWQIADIELAVREADAGDFATDAEMDELWVKYHADFPESTS